MVKTLRNRIKNITDLRRIIMDENVKLSGMSRKEFAKCKLSHVKKRLADIQEFGGNPIHRIILIEEEDKLTRYIRFIK